VAVECSDGNEVWYLSVSQTAKDGALVHGLQRGRAGRQTTGSNVGVDDERVVVRTAAHARELVGLLEDLVEELLEQALDDHATVAHLHSTHPSRVSSVRVVDRVVGRVRVERTLAGVSVPLWIPGT
jgi:hypothetical protein